MSDPRVAEIARFVTSCRIEHDADPAGWHREMLEAPRTRSAGCGFCGAAWPADTRPAAGERS